MEQAQTAAKADQEEIFENDIKLYLTMFCEEMEIENMKKEPQSVWNGALMYIRRHVFSNSDLLKSRDNIYINNNNIPSNFNAYNYDMVNDLCDYYIYMCMMYDKEVSIIGFSNLTGIDTDTINDWGNNNTKLSSASSAVYKKLRDYREESLSNKLVTGKQNPVGVLGVLNRHYAWNMPGVRQDSSQNKALALEDIKSQLAQLEKPPEVKAIEDTGSG